MKKKSSKKAFSFLELSISILLIGILTSGIVSGIRIKNQSNLKSAQSLTMSSPVWSIPDLVLWLEPTLDSSFDDSISDGDSIYSWNDISNSKINLSQTSATNAPKYLSSGINDLPSVSFDNSSKNIIYSSGKAPISKGNGQYTMIVVFHPNPNPTSGSILVEQKPTSDTANKHAAIKINLVSGGGYIMMQGQGSNDTGYFNTTAITSTGNADKEGVYTFAMVVDNTQSSNNVSGYLNTNSATYASNTSISALNIANDIFAVGGRLSSTGTSCSDSCFNGLISEVIVFNRNLNPTEITSVNNYLSKKYKITLT